MSENDFGLPQPDHLHGSHSSDETGSSGPTGRPLPRWLRGGTGRAEDGDSNSSPDSAIPAPADRASEPTPVRRPL